MSYDKETLKAVPVRRRSAARLAAVQIIYQTLITSQSAVDAESAAQLAEGWSLDRLARIELSVLRCGAYELRSMQHIPARAVVSEYAALSDACGCDVGFVNAVLDRVAFDARIFEMGT